MTACSAPHATRRRPRGVRRTSSAQDGVEADQRRARARTAIVRRRGTSTNAGGSEGSRKIIQAPRRRGTGVHGHRARLGFLRFRRRKRLPAECEQPRPHDLHVDGCTASSSPSRTRRTTRMIRASRAPARCRRSGDVACRAARGGGHAGRRSTQALGLSRGRGGVVHVRSSRWPGRCGTGAPAWPPHWAE